MNKLTLPSIFHRTPTPPSKFEICGHLYSRRIFACCPPPFARPPAHIRAWFTVPTHLISRNSYDVFCRNSRVRNGGHATVDPSSPFLDKAPNSFFSWPSTTGSWFLLRGASMPAAVRLVRKACLRRTVRRGSRGQGQRQEGAARPWVAGGGGRRWCRRCPFRCRLARCGRLLVVVTVPLTVPVLFMLLCRRFSPFSCCTQAQ